MRKRLPPLKKHNSCKAYLVIIQRKNPRCFGTWDSFYVASARISYVANGFAEIFLCCKRPCPLFLFGFFGSLRLVVLRLLVGILVVLLGLDNHVA